MLELAACVGCELYGVEFWPLGYLNVVGPATWTHWCQCRLYPEADVAQTQGIGQHGLFYKQKMGGVIMEEDFQRSWFEPSSGGGKVDL